MKKGFCLVIVICFFGAISFAQLDTGINPQDGTLGFEPPLDELQAPGVDESDEQGFLGAIQNILNIFFGLAAFLITVIFLWAGFQMVTAAGDDGRYQGGFKIMKHAIIGIVIIFLAFLITRFIFQVLNVATVTDTNIA